MAKKSQATKQAEAFVQKVLTKSFKQKVNAETVRAVAAKVREAVPAQKAA